MWIIVIIALNIGLAAGYFLGFCKGYNQVAKDKEDAKYFHTFGV